MNNAKYLGKRIGVLDIETASLDSHEPKGVLTVLTGRVAEGLWASRDLLAIESCCREDVRLAYRVYCRLTYQEAKPLSPIPVEAESLSMEQEPSMTDEERLEEITCAN